MKRAAIAAISATFLLFTSSIASAQVCAVGLIVTAAIVSAQQNRVLTSKEAMTCGLSSLFESPKAEPKEKKKMKKIARRAKHH